MNRNPAHPLIDTLITELRLKNDAALCRALEIAPAIISKIRHRVLPVSPSLMILIHDVTDKSIADIKVLVAAADQQVAA